MGRGGRPRPVRFLVIESVMLELAVVVALVVLTSAACSLFEAVLYSVPLSQIDALERAGKPSGPILRVLRSHVKADIGCPELPLTSQSSWCVPPKGRHLGTENNHKKPG